MSGRLERAVVAFRRQEFGSSVAAIIGFLDILIEDGRNLGAADLVADLERMRVAAAQLAGSIAEAVDLSTQDAGDTARLRHDLRTPLNAIKGYGELLAEEIRESGPEPLLTDLGKVLDLADRLFEKIDCIVETASPPIDIVGNILQTIRSLDEADIPDPRAASSHVLVVDDNAANRELLSRRLAREGYRVSAVESGEAALSATVADNF